MNPFIPGGEEGFLGKGILRKQDNGASLGGGSNRKENATPFLVRKVVVKEGERPFDDNITIKQKENYLLGRAETDETARIQIDALKAGYNYIGIELDRPLKKDEKHGLSRQQLSMAFGRNPGEDHDVLYVHNKGSKANVLVYNRARQKSGFPEPDDLQRLLPATDEDRKNGGATRIKNYENNTILVPMTTETALKIDTTGCGVDMSFKAWVVDKKEYDDLLQLSIDREEQRRVPEKQSIKVEIEKPDDKPQIKLEPGKKYKVGRKTDDGSNQNAAEEVGFGFIEITGDHGQEQLSKDQLEVEVVGDPESPELRVRNTGRDHVTVYDKQGKGRDKLFGRIQPSATAKRETIIPVNAGLRLNCALNSQYSLSLEPEVLSDGTVRLYVSEYP